ncbi:6107_t:CDS:2, partial [Acaulospora colombiana]
MSHLWEIWMHIPERFCSKAISIELFEHINKHLVKYMGSITDSLPVTWEYETLCFQRDTSSCINSHSMSIVRVMELGAIQPLENFELSIVAYESSSEDSSEDDSSTDNNGKSSILKRNGNIGLTKSRGEDDSSSEESSSSDDDSSVDNDHEKEVSKNTSTTKVSKSKGKGGTKEESSSGSEEDSEEESDDASSRQEKKVEASEEDSSDGSSDDSSDANESSEEETVKVRTNEKKKKNCDNDSSSDDGSSSEESDSSDCEEEKIIQNDIKNHKISNGKKKHGSDSSSSGEDELVDDDDEKISVNQKPSTSHISQGLTKSDESFNVSERNGAKRKANEPSSVLSKKPKIDVDSSPSCKLFIGNLAYSVDNDSLREAFKDVGKIVDATVEYDTLGRSKGFGYIEFESSEAAQEALKLSGKEIDGRPINIKMNTVNNMSEPSDTIFVGNLPFSVPEDDIYEVFGNCGEIVSVRLPTHRDTGGRKGFGYVTFSSVAAAKKAMELHGTKIGGRSIKLDFAESKPSNS